MITRVAGIDVGLTTGYAFGIRDLPLPKPRIQRTEVIEPPAILVQLENLIVHDQPEIIMIEYPQLDMRRTARLTDLQEVVRLVRLLEQSFTICHSVKPGQWKPTPAGSAHLRYPDDLSPTAHQKDAIGIVWWTFMYSGKCD